MTIWNWIGRRAKGGGRCCELKVRDIRVAHDRAHHFANLANVSQIYTNHFQMPMPPISSERTAVSQACTKAFQPLKVKNGIDGLGLILSLTVCIASLA